MTGYPFSLFKARVKFAERIKMTVIKFQNVSKQYKLYSCGGLYLRDRMTHFLHSMNPFNGRSSLQRTKREAQCAKTNTMPSAHSSLHPIERDFWALKNVSFEIKQGESVGFIGRNGAGKSTILKLLAGVTKATSGEVVVDGRIAALIEVGAGFHPELTGRENIYLNGSILGLKKAEIDRALDSIVCFAELENFIDTPVKRYSSGMYVRLGFAIAAHTNPDIFLVDEVLAVGDEAFQKKCLDTMATHSAAGKTILLVSHDLRKIEEACNRCIYINEGEIRYDGSPGRAISHYRDGLMQQKIQTEGVLGTELATKAQIVSVTFHESGGSQKSLFRTGDDLIIAIRYRAKQRIANPVFGLGIYGPRGEHITGFNTRTKSLMIDAIKDQGSIYCRLNRIPLQKGFYYVSVQLHNYDDTETYDVHNYRYSFEVVCDGKHSAGLLRMHGDWSGDVGLRPEFEHSDVLYS